jgi:thioesterase domain-containing protein
VRPLFLAPGLLAQSSEYANLANALHADIPVYAIQPSAVGQGDEADRDLAAAARQYAEEVQKAQPSGPYALAGYSAGGIVAVAIAQALHEAGEKTDFVGLIDSTPPTSIPIPLPFTSLKRSLRLCRTIADRFRELSEGPYVPARLWGRAKSVVVRSLMSWFPFAAWRQQSLDDIIVDREGQFKHGEKELMQRRLDAVLSYELRPEPIDLVLLRTRVDPIEGPHEPDLAWGRATRGKVIVEQLPGSHEMLLAGDGAKQLARALERHLLRRGSQLLLTICLAQAYSVEKILDLELIL